MNTLQSAFRPLLIRNGIVVNEAGRAAADVLIRDGKIVAISKNLPCPVNGVEVIDATGAQLLPGGIDPHVHLSPFMDDFDSGSKAALAGGITTIGVMSFAEKDESLDVMLARHENEASAHSGVDVVLHAVLNAHGVPRPDDLLTVAAAGQTTCKIFTMLGDFDRDYARYIELLHRARSLGLVVMFHCEDHSV